MGFRPIALVSVISKLMERAINIQIINDLEKFRIVNDSLMPYQNAPLATCSLISLKSSVIPTIEIYGESQIVALDISDIGVISAYELS